jgi:hypothetical protein
MTTNQIAVAMCIEICCMSHSNSREGIVRLADSASADPLFPDGEQIKEGPRPSDRGCDSLPVRTTNQMYHSNVRTD